MDILQGDNMKVTLIDCTGFNEDPMYAADILLFTKSTRLDMSTAMDWIKKLPIHEKMKELEYMSNTIPSSWEFVDYTFFIQGVGRGFTHQFVRSRHASFAQQTMRVLKMEKFGYVCGDDLSKDESNYQIYEDAMANIQYFYNLLLDNGVKAEDARGILPTNISTNIAFKCNLRTFSEMASKRASSRTQDEYRHVLDAMITAVLEKHPWAHLFLRNRKADAAGKLEQFIIGLQNLGQKERTDLIKLVDILRG